MNKRKRKPRETTEWNEEAYGKKPIEQYSSRKGANQEENRPDHQKDTIHAFRREAARRGSLTWGE